MSRIFLASISSLPLLFASTSAFACPIGPTTFGETVLFSSIGATFVMTLYAFVAMIWLAVLSGRRELGLKQALKSWFGAMLVGFFVSTVGFVAASYIDINDLEVHAFLFAASLPLVAMAGLFTRLAHNLEPKIWFRNAANENA